MMSVSLPYGPTPRGRGTSAAWLLIASWAPHWALAGTETSEILVVGEMEAKAAAQIHSSDTASLLGGVEITSAGGISGLHGLGDDRIRILVNGVPVTAACPMHMNPPLSYIDPSNVGRIEVVPGLSR